MDVTEPGGDSTSPSANELADKADAAFDAALTSELSAAPATEPAKEGSTPTEPVSETKTEGQAAGSTPTAEAAPVAPDVQDSPEFQNLLAKYGGDKNAAGKSYWETVKAAATLAKEKEELAAKLAAYEAQGSTPKPPAEAKPADIPSELRRYDEKIRAVETNFAKTQTERTTYVNERARLDQQIRTLNRQLGSNNLALDKEALTEELRTAINEREAVDNYVQSLDQKLVGFDETWQDLKDRRAIREQILEQAKEIQAAREAKARFEEERETHEYVSTFSQSWNGAIEKVAKDKAIVPEELSQGFEKYVRQLGKAYVADGTPITDVDKFVRDAAAEYVGDVKKFHESQSRLYAKQKKDDAKTEAPTGSDALASETKRPRSDWTQQQWREYEENLQL